VGDIFSGRRFWCQRSHEFGVAAQRPGVNSNLLSDETRIDALSCNAVLNGIPVEISAAS